jgi:hypothetical protein
VGNHIPAYLFPPKNIRIWGGPDSTHLKLIGNYTPVQPKKYEPVGLNAENVAVKKGLYQFIKIEADPVPVLPPWHEAMKQKKGKDKKKDKKENKKEDYSAWLFIDEIFFN